MSETSEVFDILVMFIHKNMLSIFLEKKKNMLSISQHLHGDCFLDLKRPAYNNATNEQYTSIS